MITISSDAPRCTAETVRRFAGIPTADLADALGGSGAIDHAIRPLFAAAPFVGSALTVETPPNDNLAPYVALDMLRAGDVLMVSTRGFTGGATLGDSVMAHYDRIGIAGVVLDGLVRDMEGLRRIGLPVYARGLSPNAPIKKGPGSVGLPVVVGGVSVASGDIVAGDEDGVVVVPAARIDAVLARIEARRAAAPADPAALPGWLEDFLAGDEIRRI
jgi:4-hydroxy-4-methyl-2-oxoglutarate aldolase